MSHLPLELGKLIYSYLPQPKIVDYTLNLITTRTLTTEDAKRTSN
jgi:hypothetical protein